MRAVITKRFYVYFGICLTCNAEFQIKVNQNFGMEHYIQCAICDDFAVPSVSLNRVAMGKDDNKDYAISVSGQGSLKTR
jgi:hypothetical protein